MKTSCITLTRGYLNGRVDGKDRVNYAKADS